MTENYAISAIQSVLNSSCAYCKFISANDSGATGAHQSGILIALNSKEIMFTQALPDCGVLERTVDICWQNDFTTHSKFKYYSSKKEFRITTFGHGFPFLRPEQTGDLFVLTQHDFDNYQGFFLETEDDINQFLDVFGMALTETNRLIDASHTPLQVHEQLAIKEFIDQLTIDFPLSEDLSAAARMIQNTVYNHLDYVLTNPDRKIIDWTNTEYVLFRALEHSRYGEAITGGFSSVESFIRMANSVLNRRKSRAGKSLEHHLAALFDANQIMYSAQAVTEGRKKPDFLFPSQDAYHNMEFSVDGIVSLAAKTTCKDRWRQVLNEADRLRDKSKYLCTLQQGISPAQMDEMQAENVILVVPAPYICSYPTDRQNRIWTLSKFINYIREMEGL